MWRSDWTEVRLTEGRAPVFPHRDATFIARVGFSPVRTHDTGLATVFQCVVGP